MAWRWGKRPVFVAVSLQFSLVNRFKVLHKMLDIRTRACFHFSSSKSCDFIQKMAGLRYAQAVFLSSQRDE